MKNESFNKIAVDGDGNIVLQDISNSTITINPNDNEEVKRFFSEYENSLTELKHLLKNQQSELLVKLRKQLENYASQRIVNQQSKSIYIENLYGNIQDAKATNRKEMPKHINFIPYFNIDNLVGRKEILKSIHEYFIKNEEIFFLSGIGGIGKTSIALAYAYHPEYSKKFTHFAWITVVGSLQIDIMQQLSNEYTNFRINPDLDEKSNFEKFINSINKFQGTKLLIIDNANNPDEISALKNELQKLNWKILITSRSKPSYIKTHIVSELDNENAKFLFGRFFNKEINETALSQILNYIGNHTLMIELLAKAGNENPFLEDIDELYNLLITHGIKAEDFDINIQVGKKEEQLYDYILAVFTIKTLTESEQKYLLYFSALPSLDIHIKDLTDLFGLDKNKRMSFANTLNSLAKKGWIINNKSSFKCHQLIQTVIREKLNPDTKNCQILIRSIIAKITLDSYDNPIDKQKYIPYAESIINAVNDYNIDIAELSDNLAGIIRNIGDYQKSLEYYFKALSFYRNNKGYRKSLAVSYSNISKTFRYLGNLEKSLEFALKSLEIYSNLDDKEIPDLAQAYDNIASVYRHLGNFDESLKYNLKALTIFKKSYSEKHPLIATSYCSIGYSYFKLKEYDKALEYTSKGLELRKEVLDELHPDTSQTYINLGKIHRSLNNFDLALKFSFNALEIREKIFDSYHPTIASTLDNIAFIYLKIGDAEKNLEFALKSLVIREKILDKNHPSLANSYFNISMSFYKSTNYLKAKYYIDKAVLIRKQTLPVGHPATLESINLQNKLETIIKKTDPLI